MTTRESAVAEALESHRLHDRRSDPRFPWCICGWEPERGGSGNERIYYAHQAHVAAAVLAALDTPQPALDLHRDLVKRLGFGDNISEPMADNDTIVGWFSERCLEADEWREHERFRDDCFAAGHDPLNDCDEHGPTCCNRAHQPTPPTQAEAVAAVERVRTLAQEPHMGFPMLQDYWKRMAEIRAAVGAESASDIANREQMSRLTTARAIADTDAAAAEAADTAARMRRTGGD